MWQYTLGRRIWSKVFVADQYNRYKWTTIRCCDSMWFGFDTSSIPLYCRRPPRQGRFIPATLSSCLIEDLRTAERTPVHEQQRGRASPSTYAAQSAAAIYGQTPNVDLAYAVRASHVSALHTNPVFVQKLPPTDATSLYRTSINCTPSLCSLVFFPTTVTRCCVI